MAMLFDKLVDEAIRRAPDAAPLRPVVEKELLHHDILREMAGAGLLAGLTFIGGTCLRSCYGSPRLSEDLDFTGGAEFTRRSLAALPPVLTESLRRRYDLAVRVGEPRREEGNVSTWKILIETRPGRPDLPAQRIHLDICSLPSHDAQPAVLRNIYGVDLGTSGLLLQAQSREEILADKIIALAFRENRMKNRDIWDVLWLDQQGVGLPVALIPLKLGDRGQIAGTLRSRLQERLAALENHPAMRRDYTREITRFLPVSLARPVTDDARYWPYLTGTLRRVCAPLMD
jgi:predicted nucleotidyltransferase component of viral defense system